MELLLEPFKKTTRRAHLYDFVFEAFAWTFHKNNAKSSTLRLRFWSFCLDLSQKQSEELNFTISVLELLLGPLTKKQANRKARFNFTISFLGLLLKPLTKKQANRKVGIRKNKNILISLCGMSNFTICLFFVERFKRKPPKTKS